MSSVARQRQMQQKTTVPSHRQRIFTNQRIQNLITLNALNKPFPGLLLSSQSRILPTLQQLKNKNFIPSLQKIPEEPGKEEKGEPGKDGKDGKDGEPGKDGKDGEKGEQGIQGEPGKDGKDGEPGKDGKDGKDGEPGKDGKDAINQSLISFVYNTQIEIVQPNFVSHSAPTSSYASAATVIPFDGTIDSITIWLSQAPGPESSKEFTVFHNSEETPIKVVLQDTETVSTIYDINLEMNKRDTFAIQNSLDITALPSIASITVIMSKK